MISFLQETPIEKHKIGEQTVYVKREDLFSRPPLPSLSKLRGIFKLVKRLKDEGKYTCFGVLDTRISKSGWGLAGIGQALGVKIVCFYGKLKTDTKLPVIQLHEEKLGAEVIGLPAGRINILWYRANKIIKERGGFMLPMGLILNETVEETAKQVVGLKKTYSTIVVSTGTGTICSGLLKGLYDDEKINTCVVGVSCGMSCGKQRRVIKHLLAGLNLENNLVLIEPKHDYYDKANVKCPFPSSPYYDQKAWEWLVANISWLPKPVLFWNIGV